VIPVFEYSKISIPRPDKRTPVLGVPGPGNELKGFFSMTGFVTQETRPLAEVISCLPASVDGFLSRLPNGNILLLVGFAVVGTLMIILFAWNMATVSREYRESDPHRKGSRLHIRTGPVTVEIFS